MKVAVLSAALGTAHRAGKRELKIQSPKAFHRDASQFAQTNMQATPAERERWSLP